MKAIQAGMKYLALAAVLLMVLSGAAVRPRMAEPKRPERYKGRIRLSRYRAVS
ncbi:hypothetical protein LJK88_35105 [Paenibacillus sp. P26]|nr:hypothetical protein LJK88_35105 [Paenibacillus sp. P26]